MAAGRDGVLKRREFYKYNNFEKESNHYRDGSVGLEVHRSHASFNNGHRSSLIVQNSGSGQNGYASKESNQREQGELHSKFHAGGRRIQDNHAWEPPQKRRKFSPVVWDLPDKEARISSKHRITQVTSLSPTQVSLPSAQGTTDPWDGTVSRLESPPDFSSALPQGQSGNADLDVDDLQEDCAHGWNITMSRWATNGHSPGDASDDDTIHNEENSSLESIKLPVGSLEGKTTGSSGGSGGHYTSLSSQDTDLEKGLHGSDSMDVEHSETSCISNSLSDSDESGGSRQVQRNINMLQSCRSVCEFEMIKKINEGTYGVVYKARDKKTGEIVALKKVKMNIERDGFPMSSLREMNILLSFNHPSIVDVKEVVVDDFDGVFMVMEYMEYDLKGLMDIMKQPLSIGEIKSLMWQLLEGVKYLHDNWVLHRDLKTSNILLNKEGELKICDFGLSRQYGSPLKPYTSVVVTLWYRAPELLLGAKEYSTAIDMWSVGCIMAELVAKEALFKGKTEVEQLDKIFQTLGTPDEKIWPGLSKLPGSKAKFVKRPYSILRKKFPAASFTGSPVLSELGFDLLSKLLCYDAEQRITAESALLHDWFHEEPLPKSDFKPIIPSRHV